MKGAKVFAEADAAARAVANSALVKTSWHGGDPNWGRIMDALGYSGAKMREETVDIYYDGISAVKGGMPSKTPFSRLQRIVAQKKITVTINLHLGSADYTVFTTDLSTEYVKLNMGE